MYSDNLVIKLNTIAHNYRNQINRSLNEILNHPRYKNTGAGLASLHVEMIDGDSKKTPIIKITIDDHIFFLDKSRMYWTKVSNVKKLLEWTSTKKTTFKKVPGYKNPEKATPEIAAKRIAYAIAIHQHKTNKWKTKKWRKKSLSAILKEMNKVLAEAYKTAIEEDVNKTLEQNYQAA